MEKYIRIAGILCLLFPLMTIADVYCPNQVTCNTNSNDVIMCDLAPGWHVSTVGVNTAAEYQFIGAIATTDSHGFAACFYKAMNKDQYMEVTPQGMYTEALIADGGASPAWAPIFYDFSTCGALTGAIVDPKSCPFEVGTNRQGK